MLFHHPRTHMGGGATPDAISPLIDIELWDEVQTNPWDVLSPMVPELISLDQGRANFWERGPGAAFVSNWGA